MNSLPKKILTSIFIIFITILGYAQERPKIGLVLSGGGAHGLAHIGVIKYLEELGIEIDYITGTSMGAVVGGLSAMGFDYDDIRDIAASQDWSVLMNNNTPLNEVAPSEKAHHDRIPLSIYWQEDSFKLPQSIIRGQKLDIILSNMYSPAHRISDFNKLRIPFRCLAVDIEHGTIKAFDKGYLGDAVRASMAIPTVFPPYEIEDRLYVDGGLIRNFPVQECLEMGADYIIGVYVGSKKESKESLKSMFDVLQQSVAMGSILDSEKQAQLADVVIYPEVKDMGKFDFNNYEEFIEKGYEAARQYEDVFKEIAKRYKTFNNPIKNAKLSYPLKIKIDELHVSEVDPVLRKMIKNKLGFSSGHFVSLAELQESLSLIYGTKNFSQSSYSFENRDTLTGVKVVTKDVEPYSIGISLNRFKLYNASFIINAVSRNVLGKPSNFRMDIRISENPGMQGEYYLRIPKEPNFLVKLSGKYELYDLPLFRGKVVDRLYDYKEGNLQFEVLYEKENSMLFSAGISYRYDGLNSIVFKDDDVKRYKTHKVDARLGFEYNTLDKQVFPDQGLYFNAVLGYVINNKLVREDQTAGSDFLDFEEDKRYGYGQLRFKSFYHLSELFCTEFYINSRYATGQSFLDNFKIGGPMQEKNRTFGLVGVDDSELILDNFVALKYGMRIYVTDLLYVTPTIQYIYGRNLLSYAFPEIDRNISMFTYGVIMGVNSPIGPLTFDMGYANLRNRLVLNLGIGYRHIF